MRCYSCHIPLYGPRVPYIRIIDQARGQDGWIFNWPSSLFVSLWTETKSMKRKPDMQKLWRVSVFWFLRQGNHRKSFYCHGKYFAKENFRALAWTSAKCYCGNKTGNPEWAVSLYLAPRGACHILKLHNDSSCFA